MSIDRSLADIQDQLGANHGDKNSFLAAALKLLTVIEKLSATDEKSEAQIVDLALRTVAGLVNTGSLRSALKVTNAGLTLRPNNQTLHTLKVSICSSLGLPLAKLDSLEKLHTLSPSNLEVLLQLSYSLLDLTRYKQALMLVNLAEKRAGDHSYKVNLLAAHVHHYSGDSTKALEYYRKSLKIEPKKVHEVNYSIASVFLETGQKDKAQNAFTNLVKKNNYMVEAHHQLTKLIAGTRDLAFSREALSRINLGKLSSRQRMHYYFAQANCYEMEGNFKASFEELCNANKIRYQLADTREDEVLEIFAALNEFEKYRSAIKDVKGKTGSPSPLLIVGMPRSGTTLLEQLLSQHEQVMPGGEREFLNESFSRAKIKKDYTTVAAEYIQLFEAEFNDLSVSYVIDKMPLNFRHIGFLMQALEDIKIVHIKRDARATIWSNFKTYFASNGLNYSYNLDQTCRYYAAYELTMAYWKSVYGDRIISLDYSDVVNKTEDTLAGLFQMLGLEPPKNLLSFTKTKRSVRTASALQVKSVMMKDRDKLWHSYRPLLTSELTTSIDDRMAILLKELYRSGHKNFVTVGLNQYRDFSDGNFPTLLKALIMKESGELKQAKNMLLEIDVQHEDYYDARNNLGNIARIQGDFSSAKEFYLNAIKVKKTAIVAIKNLSALYIDNKKFSDAFELLKEIQSYNTENVRLLFQYLLCCIKLKYISKAQSLIDTYEKLMIAADQSHLYFLKSLHLEGQSLYEMSINEAKRAIETSPKNNLYLINLVNLYKKFGKTKEIENIVEQKLSLEKIDIELTIEFFYFFFEIDKFKKACYIYSLLEKNTDTKAVDLRRLRGHLKIMTKDYRSARKIFRELIVEGGATLGDRQKFVMLSKLHANRSMAVKQAEELIFSERTYDGVLLDLVLARQNLNNKKLILNLKSDLKQQDFNPLQRSEILFALFNLHHQEEEFSIAADFLVQANNVRRDQNININNNFDFLTEKKAIATVSSLVTTSEPISPNISNNAPKPIFVVGLPRSGTTYLEYCLSHYRDITPVGELNSLNKICIRLFNSGKDSLSSSDVNNIRAAYYNYASRFTLKTKYFVDKMPINFKWIKLIDSFFPEAKIIWCERDLTDAAWSIYRSFFSTQGNNFAWDAGDIVNYLSLYKNCLKFCEDSRIPVFRFNLNKSLADKKMQMKQLENFLGISADQSKHQPSTKYFTNTASRHQIFDKKYRGRFDYKLYRKLIPHLSHFDSI